MAYPKHLINEGESVALDLRPHWWFFSKHILTGIPLVIGIVLVTRINDDDVKDVLTYVVGGAAIVWALWLLVKFLAWSRTFFVITDQRVIFRTGILTRHGVEIPLERINNINFHQGIWERIIGAGDLEIQSAGEQGTSQFSDIRHPDGVQQEIYRQMEGDAKRDAGRGADAIGKAVAEAVAKGGSSIPDQIEQLAKLRDKGTITEAEFEKKKAQLLDKM
ncbi:MAG: PH domain-containing protein [Acidimicrobiia bacterium]